MACLNSTSYALMLNGRIQGGFQGKKGLRQGDPMPPMMFVLVMEYLTITLLFQSKYKGLKFHPSYKTDKLNALCVADDHIFLFKANIQYFKALLDGLPLFLESIGLNINHHKSSLYVCCVTKFVKQNLLRHSGVTTVPFPLSYLGAPLKPTKWNNIDCAKLVEKIRKVDF